MLCVGCFNMGSSRASHHGVKMSDDVTIRWSAFQVRDGRRH